MHHGSGFSLDQRRADQGADLQGFDYGGHTVLMQRKRCEIFLSLVSLGTVGSVDDFGLDSCLMNLDNWVMLMKLGNCDEFGFGQLGYVDEAGQL